MCLPRADFKSVALFLLWSASPLDLHDDGIFDSDLEGSDFEADVAVHLFGTNALKQLHF